MKIFLSYAQEDSEIVQVAYERLSSEGYTLFDFQAPANGAERFIRGTEKAIKEADYFLVFLSPSFLASHWCIEEYEFALRCEHERSGDVPFIHVLKVADVNFRDAGYLGNYSWKDISRPELVSPALDALCARLAQTGPPSPVPDDPGEILMTLNGQSSEPVFRNREDELTQVKRGMSNAAGPHFWLIMGPPQLGKTWFLDRISKDEMLTEKDWVVHRIDLRDQPSDARGDPDVLLGLLVGRALPQVSDETLRQIAIEISGTRRPHLYVLDSAELLSERTAARLRTNLGHIYRRVKGRPNARLVVIVSSRRDNGWRGLRPDPRLSPLALTEFNVDVVQQALRELAERTDAGLREAEYWTYAELAHGLTEGLPALLALCLQWIVAEEWMDLDRLAQPDTFQRLAGPYVQSTLLTSESLFPGDARQGDEQLAAVGYAYRLLSPYRLFTMSHLRHHLERDPDLTDILGRLDWSLTDLWDAISRTALLIREPREAWKRIHPAVRRLLYRYFYESADPAAPTPPGGVEAHREARRFIKAWAENQLGTEQVVGLIECLWHDANVHLPGDAEPLMTSARQLSEDLRPSEAFTLGELRETAVELMRADEEFQRTFSCIDGLFDRVVEVVQTP